MEGGASPGPEMREEEAAVGQQEDSEALEEERKGGGVLGRLRRKLGRGRPPASLASQAVVDDFMAALRSSRSQTGEGRKGRKKAKTTSSGVSTNLMRDADGRVVAFTSVDNKLVQTGAVVVVYRAKPSADETAPPELTRHVAIVSWMGELEVEQKKKRKKQLELMLGLTLFDKVGEGDGCYGEQRCFTSPRNCALFVRPWEAKLYEPEANFLGQVHKVGYLSTLSSTAPGLGWKKRWFILTDDFLYFFKTPFSKTEVGRLTIQPRNTKPADPAITGRANCLEVEAGENRTVYLSAPDQGAADSWLAAISALWPLSAARQEGTLRHHGLLKEMVKGGFLQGSVSLPPAHFASRLAEDDRDAPAHAEAPPLS